MLYPFDIKCKSNHFWGVLVLLVLYAVVFVSPTTSRTPTSKNSLVWAIQASQWTQCSASASAHIDGQNAQLQCNAAYARNSVYKSFSCNEKKKNKYDLRTNVILSFEKSIVRVTTTLLCRDSQPTFLRSFWPHVQDIHKTPYDDFGFYFQISSLKRHKSTTFY